MALGSKLAALVRETICSCLPNDSLNRGQVIDITPHEDYSVFNFLIRTAASC